MRHPRSGSLTPRERQTIALLSRGLTLRQAADLMYITRATADKHRQKAYSKLGLHSREAVSDWVIRNGLDRMTPIDTAAPPEELCEQIRSNSPVNCR